MSKIGKKPILIPEKVEARLKDNIIELQGPLGAISVRMLPYIKTEIKEGNISFIPLNEIKQGKANWGTLRSLVNNAILGVTKGFEKVLEIEGIGYRASMEGNNLILNIGYSHPVKIEQPLGIKIVVEKNTIKISGIDKDLVGRTAAKIRSMKKAEPYKGKGIKYQGEIVRRKVGKKVAGAGTK